MRGCRFSLLAVAYVLLLPALALGQSDPSPQDEPSAQSAGEQTPAPVVDEATKRGREAYLRGVVLAKNEQWGDALEAFQEAATARNAPLVQFNIAYCQRALGHYVAARASIERALKDADELPPPQRTDAEAYQREFEQLIAQVDVLLDPAVAALSVDGRPLVAAPNGFLAGVAVPGEGEILGPSRFTVHLDPGVHIFRAVREGHAPAVVKRSYTAGQRAKLDLSLDVLPATVRIESHPRGAIVRVSGREVGVTPIEFERVAGRYEVEVERDEYETYTATLDLTPGQRAGLEASLQPYEAPIYTTWWFWTSAVAVVATGAVVTWAVTRPEPEPPPYDTGNTGWLVEPALVRF